VVIEYDPSGPSDRLACQTIFDVASVLNKPLVLGAWMTRLWILMMQPGVRVRATNDVDIGFDPAIGYADDARLAIERIGYVQDAHDYRFRFSRMTREGVQIVDLLIDKERASGTEPALPVFGIDTAAQSTVDVSLVVPGHRAIRGADSDARWCIPAPCARTYRRRR
jgi:hypothetical protein